MRLLCGEISRLMVGEYLTCDVRVLNNPKFMRNPAKWIKPKETNNVLGYEERKKNYKKFKEKTMVKNKEEWKRGIKTLTQFLHLN